MKSVVDDYLDFRYYRSLAKDKKGDVIKSLNSFYFKHLKDHLFSFAACGVAGVTLCFVLTIGSNFAQHTAVIFFVAFLVLLFRQNGKYIDSVQKSPPYFLFLQLFLLNLGIALTAMILKSPDHFFWVSDSTETHIPEALKFLDYLQGGKTTIYEIGRQHGRNTHAFTAIFFYIFGVNTFATIFSQLILKLLTTFFIYRIASILWGKSIGFLAIQLFGFCPTIFFYSLVLYKEGFVQVLVSGIIFFTLKIFKEKKYGYSVLLVSCLWLLLKERFYLTFLFIPMVTLFFYELPVIKRNRFLKAIYWGAVIMSPFVYLYYQDISLQALFNKLSSQRGWYSSFSDVRKKYNYDIPYFVAFIKIIFTPYFAFNKFRIFDNFSFLLIWGAFVNQLIILFSWLGLKKLLLEKKIQVHLYIWFPFIVFLLIAAYVSPWSGRLRDSFYPIIACYAGYYIYHSQFWRKKLLAGP